MIEITTPYFWDCECETDYIHHKRQISCPICGKDWLMDEMPDSIITEVDNLYNSKIPAKTGLLPIGEQYPTDLALYPLPYAYRSPSGYKHNIGTTALDVLYHEYNNGVEVLPVPPSLWDKLAEANASEVAWVCAHIDEACRYGEDIQKIEFTDRIIFVLAGDGDGGLLVFTPNQKIQS